MNAVQNPPAAPVKAGWIVLAVAWLCMLVPIPGLGLFLGWPLNLVAFIIGIVVIVKGSTGQGIAQIAASIIVTPAVYFISLAIFAGVVGGAAAEGARVAEEKKQEATAQAMAQPAIPVTARDYFSLYQENEVAADAQFKDKHVEITGTVAGINKDVMDKVYVELETSNQFMSVHASGVSQDVAARLSKGDQVTLNCVGAGMIIGTPRLEECRLP